MSGRLDEEGLWLDLHLESADYYAEREGDPRPEGEQGDWRSPIVWGNYHAAKIRPNLGARIATRRKPLTLDAQGGFEALADTRPPEEWDDHAFHIYLLGHDAIAKHRIHVRPNGHRFDVTWDAKLALAYAGDYRYRYEMHAEITDVGWDGFVGTNARWQQLVADPSRFAYADGALRPVT